MSRWGNAKEEEETGCGVMEVRVCGLPRAPIGQEEKRMLQLRGLRKVLMRAVALACAVCLFMGADIGVMAKDSSTAIGMGIDVSSWQGDVDWNAVAASGVQFAFIRVGSMKNGLDVKFNQNMAQANAAGIKTGVYIYSYALDAQQAAMEAVFVLAAIQNHTVNMPVVIDIENSTQEALTREQQAEIANTFCMIIEGAGYYPMVYASKNWFLNRMGPIGYDKWVAQYNVACDIEEASFWQASSTGRIPGIEGNVDIDYQYKDLSAYIIPYGFLYRKGNYFFYENYKMKTNSFVTYNGGVYYVNEVGCRVSGMYPIGGYMHYFNEDGLMLTGFQVLAGNTYYFDPEGRMAVGLTQIGDQRYLFGPDGIMYRGWLTSDALYYFHEDGRMATGLTQIGTERFYFDGEGRICLGWQDLGGALCYFDPATGKMLTGWNVIGTDTYYFDPATGAKQTGWLTTADGTYYLGTEGKMYTGLQAVGDAVYCFDATGKLYTGYLSDGVNTFYFSPVDGKQVKGWTAIDGGLYFFAPDSGIMYTGLQNIGGQVYLFDAAGRMQTGWQEIGGLMFNFGEDGVMVQPAP